MHAGLQRLSTKKKQKHANIKKKKRKKASKAWKRSKMISVCRWHDLIYEKP